MTDLIPGTKPAIGRRVRVLHIGKTAGTALKSMISAQSERHDDARLRMLSHQFTFQSVIERWPKARIGFVVREPIDRFVSGFNSRLRKGRPRINKEWSEEERTAFEHFPTPRALADGLASAEVAVRKQAEGAMDAILHVRKDLTYYLHSPELLQAERARICFIACQEEFDSDIDWIRGVLKIDSDIDYPRDDVGAHKTPEHMDTGLSSVGRAALEEWYRQDTQIYQWCLSYRAELKSKWAAC